MTAWKHTIDVSDLFAQARNRILTASQLGAELSERLSQSGIYVPEYIRKQFSRLPDGATFDDFDVVLERLYDWGDEGKRLFVKTFKSWP